MIFVGAINWAGVFTKNSEVYDNCLLRMKVSDYENKKFLPDYISALEINLIDLKVFSNTWKQSQNYIVPLK